MHTDAYEVPFPTPFFAEGVVKVIPLTAQYKQLPGEIRLTVHGTVTSVAGPPYSEIPGGYNGMFSYDPVSTRPGDPGAFKLVSDFPLHRDDSLQTAFGCAGGSLCFHQHNYTVRPDNNLRVTITRPEPL